MEPPHKVAEVTSRTPAFMAHEASKPFGWDPAHFVEWATVATMLDAVGAPPGARVLDVGSGSGWTSLFMAEAGFDVLGVDLVPSNVELAQGRAERWGSGARFAVGDMDELTLGEHDFDIALLFDALHHSARQADALRSVAAHLRPGGWLIVGEPTWLHGVSPGARSTRRELGWLERGLTLRGLRRDLRSAGFQDLRRFFQGTRPYERWGLLPQLARLVGARLVAAPQHHLWLAARKPPKS
jgi:SAM-dependent methyltransferase